MPKRTAETYTADDGFVEDAPAEKKSKRSKAPAKPVAPASNADPTPPIPQKDDQGDSYIPLNANGTRRCTLNKFKGKWMVNLREYYDAGDGVMKPGKKGISLPLEQYSTLIKSLPALEALLVEEGEMVPRPEYGSGVDMGIGANVKGEDDDGVKDEGDGEGEGKKNYESTSEEE